MEARPRALKLNPRDNVAVAVRSLAAGEQLTIGELEITVGDPIPFGHKVTLSAVRSGGDIIKYGEVVGRATADIPAGRHVHVHNVVSSRLPG